MIKTFEMGKPRVNIKNYTMNRNQILEYENCLSGELNMHSFNNDFDRGFHAGLEFALRELRYAYGRSSEPEIEFPDNPFEDFIKSGQNFCVMGFGDSIEDVEELGKHIKVFVKK